MVDKRWIISWDKMTVIDSDPLIGSVTMSEEIETCTCDNPIDIGDVCLGCEKRIINV